MRCSGVLDMLRKAWHRKGAFIGEHDLFSENNETPSSDAYYRFDNRPCLSRIVIGR